MVEPIDMIFVGALMYILGIFGYAFISDTFDKYPSVKWWWLAFWCGPPTLKLWFSAIFMFAL